MDSPSPDLEKLLAQSLVPVVSSLTSACTITDSSNNNVRSGKKLTLGLRFVNSMRELMSKLDSSSAHYIRCIKPNSLKLSSMFSGGLVLEQLRYSGIFEALAIRRSGLPFRSNFCEFMRRYKCVFKIEQSLHCRESSTRPHFDSMSPIDCCREVLAATGQDFDALRMV